MSYTTNVILKIENNEPLTLTEALFGVAMLPDEFTISLKCIHCNKSQGYIALNKQQFIKWKEGYLIQDCFPQLSLANREIMISGIGPCCYPKDEEN